MLSLKFRPCLVRPHHPDPSDHGPVGDGRRAVDGQRVEAIGVRVDLLLELHGRALARRRLLRGGDRGGRLPRRDRRRRRRRGQVQVDDARVLQLGLLEKNGSKYNKALPLINFTFNIFSALRLEPT